MSDPTTDTIPSNKCGPIHNLFNQQDTGRSAVLKRARAISALTLPWLVPAEGKNKDEDYPTPYSSTGARAVNTLSSKVQTALFPANLPFFKYNISDPIIREIENLEEQNATANPEGKQEEIRSTIDKRLAERERDILNAFETLGARPKGNTIFQYLLTVGNCLGYVMKSAKTKIYKLSDYIVRRDGAGTPVLIITREEVSIRTLPKNVKDLVKAKVDAENKNTEVDATIASFNKDFVTLFTKVELDETGKQYNVEQEALGISIPDKTKYKKETLPWRPFTMYLLDGDDYGRGMVEHFVGDIRSTEALQRAIIQFAAAASRIVHLVKPGSTTDIEALASAESGEFVTGKGDDISTIELQKNHDFRIAAEVKADLEGSLEAAFLTNRSAQRDAERVTAEEVKLLANEIESNLGGAFSILSQEVSLPWLLSMVWRLEKNGTIPKLPKNTVRPTIVTGIEALGRGNDLNNLTQLVQFMGMMPQPIAEKLSQKLDEDELLTRAATALGIETPGLIKTSADLQAEAQAQQEQQQQMMAAQSMSDAGPGVAKEVAKGLVEGNVDGQALAEGMAQAGPPQ